MKKIIILIISFFLFINSLEALEISDYKLLKKNDPKALDNYLLGVFSGLMVAETWAEIRGLYKNKNKLIFCLPGDLVLNNQNLMTFIEEQHEKDIKANIRNYDKQPVALLLIHRLETVFPCK